MRKARHQVPTLTTGPDVSPRPRRSAVVGPSVAFPSITALVGLLHLRSSPW